MCDYIIKHYWDTVSKSATLFPEWLGEKSENLDIQQQELKKIYQQTIGNATKYESLAKNEPLEEVIGEYHIQYSYVHKKDPLGKDGDDKIRYVTDIEMCVTKIKSGQRYKALVLSLIALFVVVVIFKIFVSENEKKSSDKEVLKKTDIKNKHKNIEMERTNQKADKLTLKETVCGSDLRVNLTVSKGIDKCWQLYVEDRCTDKTSKSLDEYWNKKVDDDCIWDDSSRLIRDTLGQKKLPGDYKKFFEGEKNGTK